LSVSSPPPQAASDMANRIIVVAADADVTLMA
jgi:hypothetical protein